MVYVGIDVHCKRSQVAVLDGDGSQLSNRNFENSSRDLRDVLEELEPGTGVAFEAAYGWGWLADLLEQLQLEAHLVHPSACKAIASARLKNDRVDARMLAHLLRADLLPEAWIAPKEVRDLRALLRHRAWLVRVRTSLRNRIHAQLADEGVKVDNALWTFEGQRWLATVSLRATHRAIVDDCCGLLDAVAIPISGARNPEGLGDPYSASVPVRRRSSWRHSTVVGPGVQLRGRTRDDRRDAWLRAHGIAHHLRRSPFRRVADTSRCFCARSQRACWPLRW